MAIKISGESIINDDRFIVSPSIQKIKTNTTLVRGYAYRTASNCLVVEPNVILTIETERDGNIDNNSKDGAVLTIGQRGSSSKFGTSTYTYINS